MRRKLSKLIRFCMKCLRFDSEYYLCRYPDISLSGINPLKHFWLYGFKENRKASLDDELNPTKSAKRQMLATYRWYLNRFQFDKEFYLNRYPDVNQTRLSPWEHYKLIGSVEGRFVNLKQEKRAFNEQLYLSRYPEVLKSGMNAWEHYDSSGRNNGCSFYRKDGAAQHYIDIYNQQYNDNISGTIAVHAHVYYVDLVDEIIKYLNNIPYIFDLYVSVTKEENIQICLSKFSHLQNAKEIIVKQVPNKGRDVGPLLSTFNTRLKKYDFLCHIHTKKSKDSPVYSRLFFWRKYLLDSLLGSEKQIRNIFHYLNKEKTALVFPEPFYALNEFNTTIDWLRRYSSAKRWCGRVGLESHNIPKEAMFSAGTMFWCRVESIKRILETAIDYTEYPNEDGTWNDGTFVHFLERALAWIPLQDGYENYIVKSRATTYFGAQTITDLKRLLYLRFFDKGLYLTQNPYATDTQVDPLAHCLMTKHIEGLRPYTKFDKDFLNQCLEKWKATSSDPDFDATFYLSMYFEVAEGFLFGDINPYEHYELFGKNNGFLPNNKNIKSTQEAQLAKKATYSIVVPVYNSEEFLRNCLESAYNQTVENVEVIIVNDGSLDDSASVINEFQQLYPNRTTVITHEKNEGLLKTHMDGIASVKGEFFTILDGDDWLCQNFCEYLGTLAIACNVSCVCCGWTRPKEYTAPEIYESEPTEMRLVSGETKDNSIAFWKGYPNIHYGLNRKLYRTKSWESAAPFNDQDDVLFWEDAIGTIRYMLSVNSVLVIKDKLYNWFDNADSVGNKIIPTKFVEDAFFVVNRLSDIRETNKTLYERNIDNIFLTEFLRRLVTATKVNPFHSENLIKCFARLFDDNRHLFTDGQAELLVSKMMNLYSIVCRRKAENFILFVDPLGIDNLKRFFLDYWEKNFEIPFKYIQCQESNITLSKRLFYNELGHRCKAVVTTGGWADSQFLTNRPIIQLWHGMGALKKVERFSVALRPILAFCSSEGVKPVYSELFRISSDKLMPYGSIVADFCLDNEFVSGERSKCLNKYPQCAGKKVYLWCPTFRGVHPQIYISDNLDFDQISKELKNDEILLVKYHPALKKTELQNSNEVSNYSNIIDVTGDNLLEILSITTSFMTDYSSSLCYAMLMDIPVCFMVTDEAQLTESQALHFKFDEKLPGPKITDCSPESFLKAFRSAKSGTEEYLEFKRYHLGGCDGHSRERIAAAIYKKVKQL